MTVRGEPTWQPISALPTIAMLIDEGLRDARERYATLLEAQPKPYVLDDATIARVKRANAEGLEYGDVYDQQLCLWRSERLTDAQQRETVRLQNATRELRLGAHHADPRARRRARHRHAPSSGVQAPVASVELCVLKSGGVIGSEVRARVQ